MANQLNLQEILQYVGKISLVQEDKTFGFIFPTGKRASSACTVFHQMIQQLPDWIRPNTRVKRSNSIDFDNGVKVRFLCTVNDARGMTFDAIFVSDGLSEYQKTEFSFVIIPTMAHRQNSIIDFNDNV